ncbi:winged helix-turn-helix transcriptional regulator [Devosia sp. PTR5]|uniref:Winged helix-turn-helix transcriptional regulator n=1 Tax=Devosia oryzisoli TaxID=2774138 RepID=A0A927IRV8_9HYPH|nr:helix-turn-helix domain-containing protein [Devosia oryzisoli]MBD8064819.1 winged helix-turn-helix transcriptional regulator [Devosia oryzisoli]
MATDKFEATETPTFEEYAALAEFRHALRSFIHFSEGAARSVGLPAQQHQALLAIKGRGSAPATVGWLAERLIVAPHTATELVARLADSDLVQRQPDPTDGRRHTLVLTQKAEDALSRLSEAHLKEIRLLAPQLTAVLRKLAGEAR